MLRDARMAGLVKLHCGNCARDERSVWAVFVDQAGWDRHDSAQPQRSASSPKSQFAANDGFSGAGPAAGPSRSAAVGSRQARNRSLLYAIRQANTGTCGACNGAMFEPTLHGKVALFPLAQLIQNFQEGVRAMPVFLAVIPLLLVVVISTPSDAQAQACTRATSVAACGNEEFFDCTISRWRRRPGILPAQPEGAAPARHRPCPPGGVRLPRRRRQPSQRC